MHELMHSRVHVWRPRMYPRVHPRVHPGSTSVTWCQQSCRHRGAVGAVGPADVPALRPVLNLPPWMLVHQLCSLGSTPWNLAPWMRCCGAHGHPQTHRHIHTIRPPSPTRSWPRRRPPAPPAAAPAPIPPSCCQPRPRRCHPAPAPSQPPSAPPRPRGTCPPQRPP